MEENNSRWTTQVGTEAKKSLNIAAPMIVTNLIYFAIIMSSLMFVGHLGVLELSSAALGNSMASVLGFTMMLGLASGLETLCGQAYGAKQYHLLGLYYQTSVLVLVCFAVLLSFLWWNMGPLLLFIGQQENISRQTTIYLRALLPALFAAAVTHPTIKFLQSQNVVLPVMVCCVTTFAVHIPLCYFLVFKAAGFLGAAWSISIAYWLILLQLLAYVAYSTGTRKERTWTGFTRPKLTTIYLYLRIAIPSAFMIIVQFWAFELLVLLSGLLPNPERELSLLSICLNTGGIMFTLPFGLSAASSTRVSNELGAYNGRGAKLATKVVVGMSIIQTSAVASVMMALQSKWGLAFSNDPQVVHDTASIMPLLALAVFLDGIQGPLGGVLRGCGLQDPATIVTIFAFYGIGVPSAVLFSFYFKWGAKGLFGGCVCGTTTQLLLISLLVLFINWDKQVEKVWKGVRENEEGANSTQSYMSGNIQEPLLLA
ncbi:hypothetical protein R1sor_024018 [Riccia sorocarpa]|uniref:Protein DETOXIFICATION n=1 Tax=Riccia sorocarpa TaxID=122646 RepID=A0ABD3GPB9_9MARC